MKCYKVGKTKSLEGNIKIQGAKNSVLPIIAASAMIDDIVTIHNCPDISDVRDMTELLNTLGITTCFYENTLYIDGTKAVNVKLEKEVMSKTRGAILLLGALLARFNEAGVAYPGGCDIGMRPIDIHLEGMTLMNVAVSDEDGNVEAYTEELIGNEIILRYPSVGATENLMMVATLAKGTTKLRNVAKEPEIIDLQDFLNKMGANITGAGTDTITIKGVEGLQGRSYSVIGDRMVAATYMIATAAVSGRVRLENVNGNYLKSEINCLRKMGCYVKHNKKGILISRDKKRPLRAMPAIELTPYPGIATDAGTMLLVAMLCADGVSVMEDKVFENRYRMVEELCNMGAAAAVLKGRIVALCGGESLKGCEVMANDLRGGAALVVAGMLAEGHTYVYGTEYICRGYEDIVRDFKSLGADITEEI